MVTCTYRHTCTSNIAPHPIDHHRIPIVNGVAQSIVLAGSDVVALAAGYRHSMVLKTDGSVWATGRNDEGQLGDGTTIQRDSFVEVMPSGQCGAVVV